MPKRPPSEPRAWGGRPRRREADLAIAATANVHGVALLTHNVKDFKIIEDLVDVRDVRQA